MCRLYELVLVSIVGLCLSLGVCDGQSVVQFRGFGYIHGVAVDSSGFVYVLDQSFGQIYKFTSAGAMIESFSLFNITLAYPSAIAVDQDDNLYVTEWTNQRVVKLNSTGYVVNVFTDASTNIPTAIAIDRFRDIVYIADWSWTDSQYRIIRIDENRVQSVFASSSLWTPVGIAVDSQSNVFVANNRLIIYKYDPSGQLLQTINVTDPLYYLWSLDIDSEDNLYVSDANNVYKLTPNGSQIAQFNTTPAMVPSAIDVDVFGNIFVSDSLNVRVLKLSPTGAVTGMFSSRTPAMSFPTGAAIDSGGNIIVSDTYNYRILKLSHNGTALAIFTLPLFQPGGIALDAAGNIFTADKAVNRIVKLNVDGSVSALYNLTTPPNDVKLDASGNMIVALSNSIIKITPAGVISTLVSSRVSVNYVALDTSSNIYATDATGSRVLKYSADGRLLQTFVNAENNFPFAHVSGVAVDVYGNIYVADALPAPDGTRIVKLAYDGTPLALYNTTAPTLTNDVALTLSPAGPLFVVDSYNQRVVEFLLPPPSPYVPPSTGSNNGLSSGAIAGIVIAGVVALILAAVGTVILWRRKFRPAPSASTGTEFVKFQAYNPSSTHPAFL